VLDIRTPEEYAAGHLPGAVLVDCQSKGFADQLRTLDPSKTYVMH
jgi:rhodanese-related sulfurtransferase